MHTAYLCRWGRRCWSGAILLCVHDRSVDLRKQADPLLEKGRDSGEGLLPTDSSGLTQDECFIYSSLWRGGGGENNRG